MKGYARQSHDEIHNDGIYRFKRCLNRLKRANWSLVSASINITDVAIDDIFADKMPFPFKMKIFEILYHLIISKMMLLIMRFHQDFGNQHKQDHQTLCSVDITIIKEAAHDSEWVAGFRNIENVLVLFSIVRLQVLYDFAVDAIDLIAIGELLAHLICDLCF